MFSHCHMSDHMSVKDVTSHRIVWRHVILSHVMLCMHVWSTYTNTECITLRVWYRYTYIYSYTCLHTCILYHIVSYCIISYYPYHITLYDIIWYHIILYCIVSYLISCHILLYCIIWYHIISYYTIIIWYYIYCIHTWKHRCRLLTHNYMMRKRNCFWLPSLPTTTKAIPFKGWD